MSVRATARVTRDGITLSARVWGLIEEARRRAHVSEADSRVVQGSWHAGTQSGGTHSGGGAADLSATRMGESTALALVHELRILCGGPANLRTPRYGWPANLSGPHVHMIVRDEPGLARAAAAQVAAYDRGRNGLASGARDPFARPAWQPWRLWGKPADWPGHPLTLGMSGPAVRDLQRALEIVADGQYGPQTKARVRAFQLARPGLWPSNGVAGPLTYQTAINWGWR